MSGLRRRLGPETIAYAVLALGLAVLMWRHVRQVDGFFLDEWLYVGGADYMWDHLPFGPIGDIPLWNRGPQRLYSVLISPAYGLFGTSTAFTVAHALNVLVLVSAIVPAALLARRVIETPWQRVLAVVLAVALPWLTLSLHLLTENLAFPLYLWATLAIVVAAETPTRRNQLLALAAVAALGLCRLNLALMFAVLVLAVIAAEARHRLDHRERPFGEWFKEALRREAIVAAAAVLGLVVGVAVVSGGSESLGAYGGLNADTIGERLFGADAQVTRHDLLTYLRGLITGTFVLPFALGLAVAFAGACGRLGRALLIPSVVGLGGLFFVVVIVSIYTSGGAVEERYVFPVVAPLAILAVAGLGQLGRVRPFLILSGVLVVWTLFAGYGRNALDAGNFFAAPGGAFWSRVVQHRLRSYEEELFGWFFIPPTGWMLIALGLCVLVLIAAHAHRRPALATAVVAGALGVCALAQVAVLDYDFKQELHGTKDAPGGLAGGPDRSLDRDDFVDRALPDDEVAAFIPAVSTPSAPYGFGEKVQFWNRDIHYSLELGLDWEGAPAPASPGMDKFGVELDPGDGLARFEEIPPEYVVMQPDDPRVQFSGEAISRSKAWPYEVRRVDPRRRALWSTRGMAADGLLIERVPIEMALDGTSPDAPAVVSLDLVGLAAARGPVRWRIEGAGGTERGTLAPSEPTEVRLEVPECPASGDCVHRWTLTASGPPTAVTFPGYGTPEDARAGLLTVGDVRLGS